MSKFFYIIIFFTILSIPIFSVRAVPEAVKEDVIGGLNKTMDEAGLEEQKMDAEGATADVMSEKVSGTIGSIMRIAVLAFVGVIFLNTVIYAGFLWMTSGGNEEKLAKAKNMITAAAIGMLLILGAYAVTWFVVEKIFGAVNTPFLGPQIEPMIAPPTPAPIIAPSPPSYDNPDFIQPTDQNFFPPNLPNFFDDQNNA